MHVVDVGADAVLEAAEDGGGNGAEDDDEVSFVPPLHPAKTMSVCTGEENRGQESGSMMVVAIRGVCSD